MKDKETSIRCQFIECPNAPFAAIVGDTTKASIGDLDNLDRATSFSLLDKFVQHRDLTRFRDAKQRIAERGRHDQIARLILDHIDIQFRRELKWNHVAEVA